MTVPFVRWFNMSLISSFDTLRSILEFEVHSNNKNVSPSHDYTLVITPKISTLENSDNFDSYGTSHHRGGRTSRGYHHDSNNNTGFPRNNGPRYKGPHYSPRNNQKIETIKQF